MSANQILKSEQFASLAIVLLFSIWQFGCGRFDSSGAAGGFVNSSNNGILTTPTPGPTATPGPSPSPGPLATPSPTPPGGPKPLIFESFNKAWPKDAYGAPDDGVFRVNGDWSVPYGGAQPVKIQQANATLSTLSGGVGQLSLLVPAHQYAGAEIQTTAGWTPDGGKSFPYGPSKLGYGYYEVQMQPSCVVGEISSFFWIEAPNYGPHEWDIEFPDVENNTVHFTLHPSNSTIAYNLGFNPCKAMHRYGFLWQPGTITFTVDGVDVKSFSESDLNTSATGFMMANAWDGNPNWGGGPPSQDAVNLYDWIQFFPNLTTVPAN